MSKTSRIKGTRGEGRIKGRHSGKIVGKLKRRMEEKENEDRKA